ncbi:L-histidine N(alpha)-methyltransferase [Dyella flava]|uniref:L-histidine N(Alpha)-methyltransferase n=1 Tax=Dyella flava TaxID=1920170 RepID=A0ABS2JYH1_9GAMM|nr:L-histidine N(alpha)-methyltransferase [Dyella flava]MBM7124031.1 L-histidine N(alpha)-methyltransferase [Dyella flava]GLQ52354.1 dimethylhistidine N-methyltransferase [Dyella flava]
MNFMSDMDLVEPTLGDLAFRKDVLSGLSQLQPAIPPRWFYDHRGSELFEDITRLPEYYPTRAEREILHTHGHDMARLIGPGRTVVEYGSGSSAKTPLLLSAVEPCAYVPIDISGEFLMESAGALREQFPGLPIHPVQADFSSQVSLPASMQPPYLGFFPGSTIGNLLVTEAVDLLRRMAKTLGPDAMLLIGIDRVKDERILLPAYDDAQGVTAQFNLNLLERINRDLDGTIPLNAFRHRARWNTKQSRVEMHLEAMRDVSFKVDGYAFKMQARQTIHTENSHKYDPRGAAVLLSAGGWLPMHEWTDASGLFSVFLARAVSN